MAKFKKIIEVNQNPKGTWNIRFTFTHKTRAIRSGFIKIRDVNPPKKKEAMTRINRYLALMELRSKTPLLKIEAQERSEEPKQTILKDPEIQGFWFHFKAGWKSLFRKDASI